MVDLTTELPGSGGGGNAGSSFSDLYFNVYKETGRDGLIYFDCSLLTGQHFIKFADLSGTVAFTDNGGQTWTATVFIDGYNYGGNLLLLGDYVGGTGALQLGDGPSGASNSIYTAPLTATRTTQFPNASGKVVIASDSTDPPVAGFMGRVDRTAQTADIASVKLTDTCPAGQYLIVGELECTTGAGGAGTVTVTFSWTNDSGAKTSAVTLSLATAGSTPILIPAYLLSGDVSWAVTHTGLYLTSQYALRVRTVALG